MPIPIALVLVALLLTACTGIMSGTEPAREAHDSGPVALDSDAGPTTPSDGGTDAAVAPDPGPPSDAGPPPPVPPRADCRTPDVWSTKGLFVWHTSAFPAEVFAPKMNAHGFDWVAIQIHDGTTPIGENVDALGAGFMDAYRAAGICVGAWAPLRTDPEGEAAVAGELVARWGFDFYIANAEMEYKYTSPDGSWSPEAFGRSARFVAAFRSALPDIPAAISSYGDASRADLDWAAWRGAGFHYLPQTYWNEHDVYEPVSCVSGALAAGWPREHVHPTIGIWGGGTRAYVSAADYLARLAMTETTGFSVYLGESMPEGEWGAF